LATLASKARQAVSTRTAAPVVAADLVSTTGDADALATLASIPGQAVAAGVTASVGTADFPLAVGHADTLTGLATKTRKTLTTGDAAAVIPTDLACTGRHRGIEGFAVEFVGNSVSVNIGIHAVRNTVQVHISEAVVRDAVAVVVDSVAGLFFGGHPFTHRSAVGAGLGSWTGPKGISDVAGNPRGSLVGKTIAVVVEAVADLGSRLASRAFRHGRCGTVPGALAGSMVVGSTTPGGSTGQGKALVAGAHSGHRLALKGLNPLHAGGFNTLIA